MTPPSARYVKPQRFAELTGYTLEAIEKNIGTGVWREGWEYRIAPDRRTLIDMDGYSCWVEGRELPGHGLIRLRPGAG
jgi:hypothetical protein